MCVYVYKILEEIYFMKNWLWCIIVMIIISIIIIIIIIIIIVQQCFIFSASLTNFMHISL